MHYIYGKNVKDIATFLPASIPGLVFWIKADKKYLKIKTIAEYIKTQLFDIKDRLTELFKDKLKSEVITEIISDTTIRNSLIRLEDPLNMPNTFPQFRDPLTKLATIDMSNLKDPQTLQGHTISLICSVPILLPKEFSSFIISHGVHMKYIELTNQLILSADFVETPTTTIVKSPSDEISYAIPTAEFSEIIIYDRLLNSEEQQQLEGYIAYKQNTQYNLPTGHPYLPDMMSIEPLVKYGITLNSIEERLNHALANAKVVHDDKQDPPEAYDAVVGPAHSALADIKTLRVALSRGALLAGPDSPLDAILAATSSKDWYPVALSQEQVAFEFRKYSNIHMEIVSYMIKITGMIPYNQRQDSPIMKGGGDSPLEKPAKSEDYLKTTELEVKSREFHDTLRERSKRISLAGKAAYSPLYVNLQSEISVIVEAFQHSHTTMESADASVKSKIDAVKSYFENGLWLTFMKFFDTTQDDAGSFREPILNRLLKNYNFIKDQYENGSYFQIKRNLQDIQLVCKGVEKMADAKTIQPILKDTYITFLKREIREAKNDFKECKRISSLIESVAERLKTFLDKAKETGNQPDATGFTDMYEPPQTIQQIYIRPISKFDTDITGISYVETAPDGILKTPVRPVFPKLFGWNVTKDKETFETAGKKFQILTAYNESIVKMLPIAQQPFIHTDTIISRNDVNRIHVFDRDVVEIVLPREALATGSYFLIYNRGTNVFSVRNGGTGDTVPDSVDILGPGDAMLYMYGPTEDLPYYGRIPWLPNQLPYDTLLNTPRTNRCAFVPELGTSVYVRVQEGDGSILPVFTAEGNLIEVTKYTDGFVYDMDDVFHSNGYSIVSTVEQSLAQLGGSRPKNLVGEPVKLYTDTRGAAILGKNLNEFGFYKIAQTPLQYIYGGIKLRGAYGDIICIASQEVFKCSRAEPVSFDAVFRSRFMGKIGENKYVFTTNSGIPILSPKGAAILVPSLETSSPAGITFHYTENDATHDIYLINTDVNTDTNTNNLACEEYPRRDITIEDDSIHLAFERYQQDKAYIEYLLSSYTFSSEQIGDTPDTATAQTAIKDAITEIRGYLDDYNRFETVFEKITNDVAMNLQLIELKFKAILQKCYSVQNDTDDVIKVYLEAMRGARELEQRYHDLEGSTEIHRIIESIHTTIGIYLKEHGATANPAMEDILNGILEKQRKFDETLKAANEHLGAKPDYITEIYTWCQKGNALLDDADDILYAVKYDYSGITRAQGIETHNFMKRTEAVEKEIHGLNEIIRAYLAEVPENTLGLTLISIPPRGTTQEEIKKHTDGMHAAVDAARANVTKAQKILDEIKSEKVAAATAKLEKHLELLNTLLNGLSQKWKDVTGRRTAWETLHPGEEEHAILATPVDDILMEYSKQIHAKQTEGLQQKMQETNALLTKMDGELEKMEA